jgi:hypothetical protein
MDREGLHTDPPRFVRLFSCEWFAVSLGTAVTQSCRRPAQIGMLQCAKPLARLRNRIERAALRTRNTAMSSGDIIVSLAGKQLHCRWCD